MPIPVDEAKKLKVSKIDLSKNFLLPDYLLKPRIIGFLNDHKAHAYSTLELYEALVPEAFYPQPPNPLDSKARELYEFGIDIGRNTFFAVKLQELFDDGKILAAEKDNETYYYLE